MKLFIDKNVLSAAVLCVADKKDLRQALQGILIHFISTDKAAIVATSGYYMFAHTFTPEWIGDPQDGGLPLIIDAEVIKQAIKSAGKKYNSIILEGLQDGRYLLGDTVFTPINACFPEYQHTIPNAVDNTLGQFNAKYLAIGQKALNLANNTKNRVYALFHNGEGVAVMPSENSIFAIMPCRTNYKNGYTPLDFSAPQELKQAA